MPDNPAHEALGAVTGVNLTNPYLTFTRAPAPGTTQVWHVRSTRSGDLLGTIKWYGAWRQYTFWPEPHTTFNTGCLDTITRAVDALTAAWRQARR